MKTTKRPHSFSFTLTPTVAAVLLLISGMALVIFPTEILGTVLRIIAALVLIAELWHVIPILVKRAFTLLTLLSLAAELVVAAVALIILINPLGAVSLVSIVFGLYVAATSALALVKLKLSAAHPARYILPVIMLIFGFVLVFFSHGILKLTMTLVGIAAIFRAALVLIGEYAKHRPKKPEKGEALIDAEYRDISDE